MSHSDDNKLMNKRHSLKYSRKEGSFYHNLPVSLNYSLLKNKSKNENLKLDGFKEFRIDYPSEKELADGWRVQLPKYLLRKRKDEKNKLRRVNHLHLFKIHLGQLPYHLMLKKKYWVKDNIYTYEVSESEVDSDIFNLATHLNGKCVRREVVQELYKKITDAGIKDGWVLLKAKSYL